MSLLDGIQNTIDQRLANEICDGDNEITFMAPSATTVAKEHGMPCRRGRVVGRGLVEVLDYVQKHPKVDITTCSAVRVAWPL
jgi:hypothetical protein